MVGVIHILIAHPAHLQLKKHIEQLVTGVRTVSILLMGYIDPVEFVLIYLIQACQIILSEWVDRVLQQYLHRHEFLSFP